MQKSKIELWVNIFLLALGTAYLFIAVTLPVLGFMQFSIALLGKAVLWAAIIALMVTLVLVGALENPSSEKLEGISDRIVIVFYMTSLIGAMYFLYVFFKDAKVIVFSNEDAPPSAD